MKFSYSRRYSVGADEAAGNWLNAIVKSVINLAFIKVRGLEHIYNSLKLFVIPVWRQLADAALNSGLADDGWLNHLIAQQRPWFHEIKNVWHR